MNIYILPSFLYSACAFVSYLFHLSAIALFTVIAARNYVQKENISEKCL